MPGKGLVWIDAGGVRRLKIGGVLLLVAMGVGYRMLIWMPGESSARAELSAFEQQVAADLRRDIDLLAGDIGSRSVYDMPKLTAAENFVADSLRDAGYEVERQRYEVLGESCANLIAEIPGTSSPDEILVIGAHYDTVDQTPGANDNGSGTVALLALARLL